MIARNPREAGVNLRRVRPEQNDRKSLTNVPISRTYESGVLHLYLTQNVFLHFVQPYLSQKSLDLADVTVDL